MTMFCLKNLKLKPGDLFSIGIGAVCAMCFVGLLMTVFKPKQVITVPTTEPSAYTIIQGDGRTPQPYITVPEIESIGVFRLTAYCTCPACCEKWSKFNHDKDGNPIGAEQTILINGYSVSADTNILPFGTVILIDGKEYKVQDRGGAIKGKRLDVYFTSHQDALNFGVQYKEIFIERKENK